MGTQIDKRQKDCEKTVSFMIETSFAKTNREQNSRQNEAFYIKIPNFEFAMRC